MSDDWSGGGYGRYPGISMTEIRRRFEQCIADASPRSISAIFRIAHEQIEARGRLGLNIGAARVSLILGIISLGLSQLVPQELKTYAYDGAGIGVAGAVLLGIGAVRIRHAVRMNLAQEKEIRREALKSIETLLQNGVDPQPLTREQRDLLREMVKKERFRGKASELLSR